MRKGLSEIVWAISNRFSQALAVTTSIIFNLLMLMLFIFLLMAAVTSFRYLAGQPMSFSAYVADLWNVFQTKRLAEGDAELLIAMSQSFVLLASVLVLFYPIYDALNNRLQNPYKVVETHTNQRHKNRHQTARTLAREFREADHVCIISGNYSWFKEDGDAGHAALRALMDHASRGEDHLTLLTYKTREDVQKSLDGFDATLRDQFLSLLRVAPHMRGVKVTIVRHSDYRKLFMIAGTQDGESEQLVTIKDKEYGRRLINTFEDIVGCAAA